MDDLQIGTITLVQEKLACLKHGEWLSDEVLNFRMRMLQVR
jgi:Ulp1 family protease